MRLGEGLRSMGVMKMLFIVRSVSLGMGSNLYEGVLVPTVTLGACCVTKRDRLRNEEVKRKSGMRKTMSD